MGGSRSSGADGLHRQGADEPLGRGRARLGWRRDPTSRAGTELAIR